MCDKTGTSNNLTLSMASLVAQCSLRHSNPRRAFAKLYSSVSDVISIPSYCWVTDGSGCCDTPAQWEHGASASDQSNLNWETSLCMLCPNLLMFFQPLGFSSPDGHVTFMTRNMDAGSYGRTYQFISCLRTPTFIEVLSV